MWRDTGLRYTPNFQFEPRLALESDANVVKFISDKHFYENDSKKNTGRKLMKPYHILTTTSIESSTTIFTLENP